MKIATVTWRVAWHGYGETTQPSVRACAADAKARDAHELWSERTAMQERQAAVLAQQEASRRERDEAHERRVRDLSHQLTETSRQALEEEVLAPPRPAPPRHMIEDSVCGD